MKTEDEIRDLAKKYVQKIFPATRKTTGLHIRTISLYSYEQGLKDGLNSKLLNQKIKDEALAYAKRYSQWLHCDENDIPPVFDLNKIKI